jgi:hypothetical protein
MTQMMTLYALWCYPSVPPPEFIGYPLAAVLYPTEPKTGQGQKQFSHRLDVTLYNQEHRRTAPKELHLKFAPIIEQFFTLQEPYARHPAWEHLQPHYRIQWDKGILIDLDRQAPALPPILRALSLIS